MTHIPPFPRASKVGMGEGTLGFRMYLQCTTNQEMIGLLLSALLHQGGERLNVTWNA